MAIRLISYKLQFSRVPTRESTRKMINCKLDDELKKRCVVCGSIENCSTRQF